MTQREEVGGLGLGARHRAVVRQKIICTVPYLYEHGINMFLLSLNLFF